MVLLLERGDNFVQREEEDMGEEEDNGKKKLRKKVSRMGL